MSRNSYGYGAIVSYDITITCPTATPYPEIFVDTTGFSGLPTWQRLQNASAPVRGTYQIGLNGNWTAPLNWNDGPSTMQAQLNMLGITGVAIAQGNNPNDGSYFILDIFNPVVCEMFIYI